jgi:hypothetical protein
MKVIKNGQLENVFIGHGREHMIRYYIDLWNKNDDMIIEEKFAALNLKQLTIDEIVKAIFSTREVHNIWT